MEIYRIYFVDPTDHFKAAQAFTADSDTEAAQVAELVHAACADVTPHFELWRGDEPVVTSRHRPPAPDLETVVRERQEHALALEDALQASLSCIARSRRLMERIDMLRRKGVHAPNRRSLGVWGWLPDSQTAPLS